MAPTTQRSSLERAGFSLLAAFLLSPVIAHGLWRPLVHTFGPAGDAVSVTGGALFVCAASVFARLLLSGRTWWLPLMVGWLVAGGTSRGLALGVPGLLTLISVATAIWVMDRWLAGCLPSRLDGLARRHQVRTAIYVLGALMAVISTARVSTFMGDPARMDLQALPGNAFTATHSCLTAYARASALRGQGVDNLYEDRWWFGSLGLPPLPPGIENPYRPFDLDNFSYPPPFLLLMAPFDLLEGDFLAQRALWFGLNGLLAAFGFWIVAQWLEVPGAHRTLLLAPLFFGSMPILLILQIGNFHLAALVLSVLAMLAFERGRSATGGALLALTIMSKISPGILGIGLLAQRRFRSAALAATFGGLLLVLSVLWSGTDPITSFLTYALPRLSSGVAFPHMDTEAGIATNMSPFGIAFKLPLLGLNIGDPWALAPLISRVYTGLLVLLAIATARRKRDRLEQAVYWMSLLTLAALQSPFSPAYSTLPLLWATTLLAARVHSLRGAIGLPLIWVLALGVVPELRLELQAIQSLVQTAVTLGVSTWLVLGLSSEAGQPHPPDPCSVGSIP